jgi:hypothetical protein
VVLTIEERAGSAGRLDVEALSRQASVALAWVESISAKDVRLSLISGSRTASLEGGPISLVPNAGGTVAFAIGPGTVALEDGTRRAGFRFCLTSKGTFRTAAPFSLEGTLALRTLLVRTAGKDESLENAAFDMEGVIDLSARRFDASKIKLAVPGLFRFDGKARGDFRDAVTSETEVRADLESIEALVARFGDRLPEKLHGLRLDGTARLDGKVRLERKNGGTVGRFDGSLSLAGLEAKAPGARLRGTVLLSGRCGLSLPGDGAAGLIDADLEVDRADIEGATGGIPFSVGMSGRVSAKGAPRELCLGADVRAISGRISRNGVSVEGSRVHLVADAAKGVASISLIDASLAGIGIAAPAGKSLAFQRLGVSGKARLDTAKRAGSFEGLISGLTGLPPVSLKGATGAGPLPGTRVRIEGKGLGVPALRALAAPFLPEAFAGWEVSGTADIALDAAGPDRSMGGWRFSGGLACAGIKLNDPGFTVAGDGLAPILSVEGSWARPRGLAIAGTLELEQGESLWKAVYIPWGSHPLKVSFSGLFDPDAGIGKDLLARVRVPTIGTVDLFGSFRTRPIPAFDVEAGARLSLAPLHALTAQEGTSAAQELKLAGTLGASLRARKSGDALSVEGRLTLAGTDIELVPSGTRLVGVAADVPVRFASAAAGGTAAEARFPEAGTLTVAEVHHPLLSLKGLSIPLRTGTNAVAVDPLGVDLFGGRLELGRTVLRFDPGTGAFRGTGSLALRDLDISKIPIPSPQFKLTGRARADFPALEISAREIAFSGRAEADVFGGKVVVRDLSVSDPFAPDRAFALNVDLVDIDLKKLTDEVPFGEVTGIVRGEVRGLVLSYGQPARFDLRIESVPRKGVPRTFSLKAVDNLTVLSSGEKASAGTAPFWMRFIRGFRYEKLGIVSTLRNDTFTLNGTIREDGVEYLVKKPRFFGINVVNRMPDKKISFREMTGRLKRVGQSEARPGEAGRREP